MSASNPNFTVTPNLGLYKPTYDADEEMWGTHLNINSDTLDALLGSAGNYMVTATGSTQSRSAQDRFAEAHNLKDFDQTNGIDYSPALNSAIAALSTGTGGKLRLPAGRLNCNSAVVATIPFGVTITIEGMGMAASQLYFSNATDGLNFTVANTAGVHLHGFSIIRGPTSPVMANTGLSISVINGDPPYTGISSLRDLRVRGSQVWANQWQHGVSLAGLGGTAIDNVNIQAVNASGTDQGDTLLSLSGGGATNQYASSYNVINGVLVGGSCGIQVSGWVQGVFVANSAIVGQYDSIRWTGGAAYGAEDLAVSNSSLNGAHRGFLISGVNQSHVANSTILRFGTAAANFAGVEINNCAYNSVTGNNIFGVNSGTETGVLISAAPGCDNTVVSNITGNIAGAGIWLQGTTTRTTVLGNNLIGGTGLVVDTPAGNIIGPNQWNGTPLPQTATTIGGYGTANPLQVNTGSGVDARIASQVTGQHLWKYGADAAGDWAVSDETAGAYRFYIDPAGGIHLMGTGTGFNGAAPVAKPTVTGAKGGNAALTSLMAALSAYGLVNDTTTA